MPTYVAAPSGAVVRLSDGQLKYLGGGTLLSDWGVTGAQLAEMVANGRAVDAADAAVDPTPTPDSGSTFSTAQQSNLSETYVSYIGTAADPITDDNTARPDTPGPVYWICADAVDPTNKLVGDIVFNADPVDSGVPPVHVLAPEGYSNGYVEFTIPVGYELVLPSSGRNVTVYNDGPETYMPADHPDYGTSNGNVLPAGGTYYLYDNGPTGGSWDNADYYLPVTAV